MSKLEKMMAFLNDEEIALVEKCMANESFRKEFKELSPDGAAREIIMNIVIHHYIGQDRAGIITDEEDQRWTDIQNKAYELGILERKRFSR